MTDVLFVFYLNVFFFATQPSAFSSESIFFLIGLYSDIWAFLQVNGSMTATISPFAMNDIFPFSVFLSLFHFKIESFVNVERETVWLYFY